MSTGNYRIFTITVFLLLFFFIPSAFCTDGSPSSDYPDSDLDTISNGEKELLILNMFQNDRLQNGSWLEGYNSIGYNFKKALGIFFEDKILQKEDLYNFNEIDPYFLEWFRRIFPLPNPSKRMSILSTLSFTEIYNRPDGVRDDFRNFVVAYVIIKQKELAFKEAALNYIHNPDEDILGYDVRDVSYNPSVLNQYGVEMNPYLMEYMKTFWARRMIDGSITAGWFFLYDILSLYDREWLKSLENAAPYAFEDTAYSLGVLKVNLKVRTEHNLSARNLGVLPHGSQINVIARSREQETLDGLHGYWYLIDSGELRGWSFGPYIDLGLKAPVEIISYEYDLLNENTMKGSLLKDVLISLSGEPEKNRFDLFLWAYRYFKSYKGFSSVMELHSDMEYEEKKYKLEIIGTETICTDILLSNERYSYEYTRLEGKEHDYTQFVSEHFNGSSAEALKLFEKYLGVPVVEEEGKSYFFPLPSGCSFPISSEPHAQEELYFAEGILFSVTGEDSYSLGFRFYFPVLIP